MVVIDGYDFKGQPKYKIRKVIADDEVLSTMPTNVYWVDWDGLDEWILEGNDATEMESDALGRPVSITLPEDVNGGNKVVEPVWSA